MSSTPIGAGTRGLTGNDAYRFVAVKKESCVLCGGQWLSLVTGAILATKTSYLNIGKADYRLLMEFVN